MKNLQRTILLIGILGFLFFLGQLLFVPTQYLNSRFGQAIQAPVLFFKHLANWSALTKNLSALSLENQSLRAEIAQLKSGPTLIKDARARFVSASVYSVYPFNVAGRIYVNAGKRAGIEAGEAVLAAPGIFLGQVASVTEAQAEIRTIFDEGWELPVRIGESRVSALLSGGHALRLTLIPKTRTITRGESAYLSSRDFPLGLTIGTIASVSQSGENPFQEAGVKLPYEPAGLGTVLIQLP